MKYWYHDNWSGKRKDFETLRKAKESAKNEDGNCIAIFNANGVAAIIECQLSCPN